MSTIKIKQVKSRIGAPADQKRTLDALGLHKLNRVVEHECTPSILGMVDKVTQYLKISATTSKSRLIQSLAAAGEIGCCMTTTEINTLVSSLGQDCGKYEDILCKAAHHEEVSSSYKIDGDPIVVHHPHLALSIAGTQEQFRNFFRSLEVGLYILARKRSSNSKIRSLVRGPISPFTSDGS